MKSRPFAHFTIPLLDTPSPTATIRRSLAHFLLRNAATGRIFSEVVLLPADVLTKNGFKCYGNLRLWGLLFS